MIYEHGGNIYGREDMLDFSANIDPLGMPEGVKTALIKSVDKCVNYPDPNCTELVKKLSDHEAVPPCRIDCGNGAADLIYRIVFSLMPKKALVLSPTFSEYKKALSEVNCFVEEYALKPENDFMPNNDILNSLNDDTDIVFLCIPNNPTGKLFPPDLLKKTADMCLSKNIVLVCDECFLGFVENGEKYSLKNALNQNCIVLNAFTKLYAMPGIRLGYAVFGDKALAEKVKNSGQSWSVSVLAQAAGIAALDEKKHREKTVGYVAAEREFLCEQFEKMGIKYYTAAANFILIRANKDLAKKMLGMGIIIRSFSDLSGLDETFFRIAVRTHEENLQLTQALKRCIYG